MVLFGVKSCVIERSVCLCLVYSKPSVYLSSFEIKAGTYTAMFFFFYIGKETLVFAMREKSVVRRFENGGQFLKNG